jgi:hypothetical protein
MGGRSPLDGRFYAFGAYTAVAIFILFIFYSLDHAGLSINVTYNATQPLLSSNSSKFRHQTQEISQHQEIIPTPEITPPQPILQAQSSEQQPQFEIKDKVAVIIESRSLSSLTPLLTHFSTVLGPTWPIVLYTQPGTEIPNSPAFRRLVISRRLDIRYLPITISFGNRQAVSNFLTEPWLYEQLAPAKHVLLFQSDSMICARSEYTVDDFLEYDFVGAPIAVQYGHGFNGGLSLRNRTMMLDIIYEFQTEQMQKKKADAEKARYLNSTEVKEPEGPQVWYEDQFFYTKMSEIGHAKLPTQDIAQKFAVETIWYDKPLGYHQVSRWQAERIAEVDAWCPEHRLVTGGQIADL